MVKGLIQLLEKGFAPYLFAALGIVLALAIVFGLVQTWRLHDAQVDIANSDAKHVILATNADTARKNTAACDAAVTGQNHQIDKLANDGDEKNQKNTQRAAKTFAKPLAPDPSSEDARGMNEWLAKVLQ